MKRSAVALGILGLVCAVALPASAQKQIKIFGTTYNVVAQNREHTYKNGVKITVGPEPDRYAGVYYAEGPDRTTDRLWFGCRIGNGEDITGDQLYYLEGPDAGGQFTPSGATAKTHFGGNQPNTSGGRPVSMIELNRDNTGVKTDRNLLVCTFYNDDAFRLYDLDSMNTNYVDDSLFRSRLKVITAVSAGDAGEEDPDPNLPYGSFPSFANLPKPDGHTVLIAAGPNVDANETDPQSETNLAIWDTRQDKAFAATTNITAQTKDQAKPFPATDADGAAHNCNTIARYGDQGEYWFLLVTPSPGGGNDTTRTAQVLVKARIEVPADPSKAKPGDLKVTVLDTQDMLATGVDILWAAETAGIVSIAPGREVTPGGPRMLYTTDYSGNFYTLTPQ